MEEKIFIAKIKRKIKTEDFIRFILKKYYKLDSKIDILRGKNGKPYIYGKNIYFSVSNKKNYISAVISDKQIGIDMEIIDKRDHMKIVDKYFTTREQNYIKNAKGKIEQNKCFFEVWTKKESLIKKYSLNLSYISKIDTFDFLQSTYTFYIDDLIITIAK